MLTIALCITIYKGLKYMCTEYITGSGQYTVALVFLDAKLHSVKGVL